VADAGTSRTRFDAQAQDFDDRAGVGDEAAAIIAAAIRVLAGGGVLLEIGAGTGEIGAQLAAAAPGYVGLDASRPMLDAFARRLTGAPALVQADAARPWPVRAGMVDAVFSSRAAHLLEAHHVVAEVSRVCRPGAHVLIGRVERERDGLRNRLRERRRALLAAHGVRAGEGGRGTQRLLDALTAAGATPLGRRDVARWTVHTSAARVIDQWDAAATVGGRPVPPPVHAAVMRDLRDWASDESAADTETYTVDGVRLP
jgi:SAM-dependent methyltransferase